MSYSKLSAFALAVLLSLGVFASARPGYADTYKITYLANDGGVFFYGFSTTNEAVLLSSNCAAPEYVCYYEDGKTLATPPPLTSNFGTPCSFTLPAGTSEIAYACENGHAAYYGYPYDLYSDAPGLYAFNVSGTPQLIYPGFLANGIHMNSLGDIVGDDGVDDVWIEAIDQNTLPAQTPEAPTFLLLATGMLAPFVLLRRRSA